MLNEELKKKIEEKLEEGQCGLREGRGAIDAIYVLNYGKQKVSEEERKDFRFFRSQDSIRQSGQGENENNAEKGENRKVEMEDDKNV